LRSYIGMFRLSIFATIVIGLEALTHLQWSMLLARLAAAPTPSSTRVRTVCTSLPATLADPVVPSPLSRLVSVDKSVAGSVLVKRVKHWIWHLWGRQFTIVSPLWRVTYWDRWMVKMRPRHCIFLPLGV